MNLFDLSNLIRSLVNVWSELVVSLLDFGPDSELLQPLVLLLLHLVYPFVDWDLTELVLVDSTLVGSGLEAAFLHQLQLLLTLQFLSVFAPSIGFVEESLLQWELLAEHERSIGRMLSSAEISLTLRASHGNSSVPLPRC